MYTFLAVFVTKANLGFKAGELLGLFVDKQKVKAKEASVEPKNVERVQNFVSHF